MQGTRSLLFVASQQAKHRQVRESLLLDKILPLGLKKTTDQEEADDKCGLTMTYMFASTLQQHKQIQHVQDA